jgi:hypothetical protein
MSGAGSAASVRLFAPTNALLQLRVEDPKYILRKPLLFTDLSALISQTICASAPIVSNAVFGSRNPEQEMTASKILKNHPLPL